MHKQNKKKPITTTSQLVHLRLVVILIDPKKKTTDKLTPERCHNGSLINP